MVNAEIFFLIKAQAERRRERMLIRDQLNDDCNAEQGKKIKFGAIAQLGERLPCTQEVGSSILPGSTKFYI